MEKNVNDISLIVLNYNDASTTINFLSMIQGNKKINHIIVVDNASTDDSYERLIPYSCKRIKIIRTENNMGYAKGNNYGVFYALEKYHSKYIIISNPDVRFDEKYIERLLQAYESGEMRKGIISGKMDSLSKIHTPIAWKLPRYGDLILSNLMILRKIVGNKCEYNARFLATQNQMLEVEVLPGSFIMIKAEVFKEIGGFNEKTFLYGEENLIAAKLKAAGYHNYLITDVEYIHEHAVSIDKNISMIGRRLDIAFESRMIYAKDVLHIDFLQEIVLKISYKIGKVDYLLLRKIIKRKR